MGLPNCLVCFDWLVSGFPFASVCGSCVWCFSCWFLELRGGFYYVGLAGGWDLGFGFRGVVGFPSPVGRPGAGLSMCTQWRGPRESWEARGNLGLGGGPRRLCQWSCFEFGQGPAKFVPIGLLCKRVTNHLVTRM